MSMSPPPREREIVKGSNIQVCVRVRPLVRREREHSESIYWTVDGNTIKEASIVERITEREKGKADKVFHFDHLFGHENTTNDIYRDVISEVVANAMLGYHGSVFSYGQTASGKTFTMNGTAKQPGIIPIAIFDAFDAVEKFPDRIFLFRVCYLEVYKEQVKDLLNPDPTSSAAIKILYDENTQRSVVRGVKEQVVMSAVQVMSLLQSGEMYRHVGSTDMNEKSSRAHTVFRLIIESKDATGGAKAPVRSSTLNLIDLAGSENNRMTGSTGDRQVEAKAINQSLLTLSIIIQRLSEMKGDAQSQHLPYRDSKLTRILEEPLSGNALVAIICTISPSSRCADESTNTLRFASRAKKVMLSAHVNEGDSSVVIRQYEDEIGSLKAKILDMESRLSQTNATKALEDKEEEEDLIDEREDRDAILRLIESMNKCIIKADGQGDRDEHSDDQFHSWKHASRAAENGAPNNTIRSSTVSPKYGGYGSHVTPTDAYEAASTPPSKQTSEVLASVASMLDMLKEKVDKKPTRRVSIVPRGAASEEPGNSMEVEALKLELKLKTADAAFLEQEVARKDAMLADLIKGLEDVENNHRRYADELAEMQELLDAEKEDNDFLRAQMAESNVLEVTKESPPPAVVQSVDPQELVELRVALARERTEVETLRVKLEEVTEDRSNWRHKYMLLSSQKSLNGKA